MMQIKIGKFDFTEVWDGVLYKNLSQYPKITDWEIRTLMEFVAYEAENGRSCTLECDDPALLQEIKTKMSNPFYRNTPRPGLLTECTACPYRKGCVTDFVCHTSSVENAAKILACGALLSAVKARGLPASTLMAEARNAAGDPEDYFHYVMLAWGNCQAGDRLVMERKLGHFPNEEDLSTHFTPGVRFYFAYDRLAEHPGVTYDGVLPMKIRDEIILWDWVHKIVIPAAERPTLDPCIPDNLREKVIYLENDCRDIWDWSEKVYRVIETTKRQKVVSSTTRFVDNTTK